MKAAFDKAAGFQGRTEAKKAVWDRFLQSYAHDNPYSGEDEGLRGEAERLKASAVDVQVAAEPPALVSSGSRRPGEAFRDCPDCPEMVEIPAGSFTMGSSSVETTREGFPDNFASRERPQHQVNITRSFALGKTHVTRGEFGAFVRETGHDPSGCSVSNAQGKLEHDASRSWRSAGFDQTDRHPVVCVSHEDAQRYMRWLNVRIGNVTMPMGAI